MFPYIIYLLALSSATPLDNYVVSERSNLECDMCQLFTKLVQNELRCVDRDIFIDIFHEGFTEYHRELNYEFGLKVDPYDEIRFIMDVSNFYDKVTTNHIFDVCLWMKKCSWNDEIIIKTHYNPLDTCSIVYKSHYIRSINNLQHIVNKVLYYARVMRNYEKNM